MPKWPLWPPPRTLNDSSSGGRLSLLFNDLSRGSIAPDSEEAPHLGPQGKAVSQPRRQWSTHGKGSVSATKAAKTHGKGSVSGTKAAEICGKGSVLPAARAARTPAPAPSGRRTGCGQATRQVPVLRPSVRCHRPAGRRCRPEGRTTRGDYAHLMLGERITSQSEVIRSIVSGYSPCCGVPHLGQLDPVALPLRRLRRRLLPSQPGLPEACRVWISVPAPAEILRDTQ